MTGETRRAGLAKARRTRPVAAEVRDEYAATRLRHELGFAVRTRRIELGLSQEEVGRRAHMTQSAVARFEAGGTVPSLPVLDRLAGALQLDLRVEMTPHAAGA